MGEACVAIFWPTPGFKGRKFVSSGISKLEGTSISTSAVLHCGLCYSGKEKEKKKQNKKKKKKQVIVSTDQPRECRRPTTERLQYQLLNFPGPANDKVHGLQFQR